MENQLKRYVFIEKINKSFDVLESLFALVFAAGVVSMRFTFEYWRLLLWIGAGFLAFVYYFKSLEKSKFQSIILNILCQKTYWIGLALLVIAIASKLNLYDNSDILIIVGLVFAGISTLLKIYFFITKKFQVSTGEILRYILISLIGGFVLTF